MYRLGIDVGGTNTDSALLDDQLNCIFKIKEPTTKDIRTGINRSVAEAIKVSGIEPAQIKTVMLGTTHCTNAIVERKNLSRVGVIRLAAPATTAVSPLIDWPQDLLTTIDAQIYIAKGGFEFNGQRICAVDQAEIQSICQDMIGKVDAVAVIGVFSPVDQSQEIQVGEWVKEYLNVPVSLSHEIGSLGLLERENATVLNAALIQTLKQMAENFQADLTALGVHADIYFCQNDGTLMTIETALNYPVLTIGCGPTNSIRGAAHLSGLTDALVVDIGGTTTDIGVLKNGFPRESSLAVEIGQVRTNFRMPDILSIGLGGGSIVHETTSETVVGPDSVGYQLLEKAQSFGGDILTATDIVLVNQSVEIPEAEKISISIERLNAAENSIRSILEEAIDRMKVNSESVPIVLVGGGSIIAPNHLAGVSQVIRPINFDAANAVGAALGEVCGEVNRVVVLHGRTLSVVIDEALVEATEKAIDAGANPATIKTIFIENIPRTYLPGDAMTIKVKVAGRLQ